MNKILLFSLLYTGITITCLAQSTLNLGTTVLTIDTVYTGLDVPWEIAWGPDGMIWTTEREGIVSRIDPVAGTKDEVLDITSTVYSQSESGLLGLAIHPQFPDSAYVYLAYTYQQSSNILERMVRYEYNGTSLVNPNILIDNIAGNTTHDGARLVIGPDNKLYMTTGDAQNLTLPQNVSSLSGKTLRFNLDGGVPVDNPISGSYVYSWGHRNAQGLFFGPNGILYSSEHGPNTDDEINIIERADNYGWPTVAGYCNTPNEVMFCNDSGVTEPIYHWTPTIAPGDLVYYDHPAIPEWRGSLLLTVLKNKQLIELEMNAIGNMVVTTNTYLNNQFGRLRDILIGPNGEIYIATNGASWSNTDPGTHSIIRLRNDAFTGQLNVVINGDNTICEGESTTLAAAVTAGTAPYTYQWSPAGTLDCDTCQTVSATPTTNTTYMVTVTDDVGDTIVATMMVSVEADTVLPGSGVIVGGWIDAELVHDLSFDVSNTYPQGGSWTIVWKGPNNAIFDTTYYTGASITDTVNPDNAYCYMPVAKSPGYCCFPEILICFQPSGSCQSFCLDTTLSTVCYGSTNDILLAEQFDIYPNPVNHTLNISNSKTETLEVRLFNVLGQEVYGQSFTDPAQEHQLDMATLKTGIYLVQIETGSGVLTKRIVKE